MSTRRRRVREAGAATASPALLRGRGSSNDPNADSSNDSQVTCSNCDGDGKLRDGKRCAVCGGTGKVAASRSRESESALADAVSAEDVTDVACTTCDGHGVVDGVDCAGCNGTGLSGGTTSASGDGDDDEYAEPGADPDPGKANVPEVRGAGGKGRQHLPETEGPNVGKQRFDEVQGAGGQGVMESARIASFCEVCGQNNCSVEGVRRVSEAVLTSKSRNALDTSSFAIPGERKYPIHDRNHAENALARVSQYGTPEEKSKVRAAVKSKYPDMGANDSKESASLLERLEALEQEVGVFAKLREARAGSMDPTFSKPVRVKTSDGREGYRVTLIREGKGNHEDDQYYSADAIRELVESGTAEGMQAFGNHPTLEEEDDRPERDVKQLVGTYHDVKLVQEAGQPTRAEGVFVPLTYDESNPHYGWVVTLAEAAARSQSPQPVCGISLYGFSVGDDADRPDGSFGRMVEMIRPSSGDIVTNAGAGGGFIRQLMESARALRQRKEISPMRAVILKEKYVAATKRVREATTDEEREAALAEMEALESEKLDEAPNTVEALTEAAPQLVERIRESVKADSTATEEELRKQLREAEGTLSKIADISKIAEVLRECEVTDEKEKRYFISQCQTRGLREAEDIRDLVNTEREYRKDQEEATAARIRESLNLEEMEVEGVFARVPAPQPDAVMSILREAGIPLKEAS